MEDHEVEVYSKELYAVLWTMPENYQLQEHEKEEIMV